MWAWVCWVGKTPMCACPKKMPNLNQTI
jgi:hypothetical protein